MKNKKQPKIKSERIFLDRLIEWYSVRQLSDQNNKNETSILEYIRNKLDNDAFDCVDEAFDDVKHIMIDWVWVRKNVCLIVYYEYNINKILRFGFYDWERYEYIANDLRYLKQNFQYKIESFTVDWWLQIASAIKEIYPKAKTQRCLVHIHRQIRSYISKNPKTDCWKELKNIVTFINFKNYQKFEILFLEWINKRDKYLKEKTYWEKWWRYTHKKQRQARSHIINAMPYMFTYLNDKNISKSTNKLEWLNALIVEQIYNHRWLTENRLISLLSYWLYYRNYKKL